CATANSGCTTKACSPSARWPTASACPPPPSKSGATPGLSVASATTTRDRSSTTRPAPTHQPPTTACHGSPTGDLHKHQPPTNQPDEVQYATRGLVWGR